MKLKMLKNVSVTIERKTWIDIQNVVALCSKEVSWSSTVTKMEDKKDIVYFIESIFVPTQHVHATTTEMTPEGQAEVMMEVEDPNLLRCLGHSHVDMGTGMSGQDRSQFRTLYNNVDDFYLSIIFNKKREATAYLVDKALGVYLDEVPVNIEESAGNKTKDEWSKLIDEKVLPFPKKTYKIDHSLSFDGRKTYDPYGYDFTRKGGYKEPILLEEVEKEIEKDAEAFATCSSCGEICPIEETFPLERFQEKDTIVCYDCLESYSGGDITYMIDKENEVEKDDETTLSTDEGFINL